MNDGHASVTMKCPYNDGPGVCIGGGYAFRPPVSAATMQDTVPIATGGRCDAVCNDGFQTALIVSDTWTYFEVP